jgi:hypothetical protein
MDEGKSTIPVYQRPALAPLPWAALSQRHPMKSPIYPQAPAQSKNQSKN